MTPKTDDTALSGIKLVPEPSENRLNDKQALIYRDHRKKLARWALSLGKNPRNAEGYARETVGQRMYRLDLFYRFVWEEFGDFTVDITTEHADEWMKALTMQDTTETYNASCQKAVKMLCRYFEFEHAYIRNDRFPFSSGYFPLTSVEIPRSEYGESRLTGV